MALLLLSNGHGEDGIAVGIARQLRLSSRCPDLKALPLVGEGHAYTKADIPLLGETLSLPSGGFNFQDIKALWRDLRSGLGGLTRKQYRLVREWGRSGGKILAVGDIFPLALARFSGCEYAFVGTAKSEYYIRDENGWLDSSSWLDRSFGSYYYPPEIALLRHPACKLVFPRDGLTCKILRQKSVRAIDAGNPMIDDLLPPRVTVPPENSLTIVLLPGSRYPEAFHNFRLILKALAGIVTDFQNYSPEFLCPLAPGLPREEFTNLILENGWRFRDDRYYLSNASLELANDRFPEYLSRSHLGIGLAGTAVEQMVGLGRPVITIAGKGPQFTPRFALLQTRLLGPSVILASHPEQVRIKLKELLDNPERWREIAENGRKRMGKPGASALIADRIIQDMYLCNP